MEAKIKAIKYLSLSVLVLSIVGYCVMQQYCQQTGESIKLLNQAIAHVDNNQKVLNNAPYQEVFNNITTSVLSRNASEVDFTVLNQSDIAMVKAGMSIELNDLLSRRVIVFNIKMMLVFLCCFAGGMFLYNWKRSQYVGRLVGMEHNMEQLQGLLKQREKAVNRAVYQYNSVQTAYQQAKKKEVELKGKIEEADAVQQEMKRFVDIQIQTNEQLMIAESKLKNLLEKEKESKSMLAEALDKLKDTQGQLVHSEKMASLGQLTAGIAHEINNPINFIYNGIESVKRNIAEINELLNKYALLEEGEDPTTLKQEILALKEEIEFADIQEDLSDMVTDIKDGAIRTIEIVKGLRVFSRLDEEHLKTANINECLEATLILLKNKTKNRIAVEKRYDEELPEILCYPGQLNQVFMNILNNAIQAIPDENEEAKITVITTVENDQVVVKLKDNGTGMSDDVKARIFEPFYTTKPVGVGTGLGMSISYGIIEKHNGKLDVESELGKGTEFSIKIPIVDEGKEVALPEALKKAV